MNDQAMKQLTKTAMMAAIIFVCTYTFKIPNAITGGYTHLGDCAIFIGVMVLGRKQGTIAAAIGAAMSDLLGGFFIWVIPTLIIKGIMGFVIGYIANRTGLTVNMFKIRTAAASIVGIIIMVVGYFIGGSILYGSIYTGATQIPGLVMEGIVGIVLFYVIGSALQAAHLPKYIQRLTQR